MVLTQPTMEGAAVFRSVGEWLALQNRWKQAADRFSLLLEVNQLEAMDLATMDYLRCGPALLEIGNTAGYDKFRQGAIARFSAGPCPFADRIVKISLLQPANAALLDTLAPLAAETASGYATADAAGDSFTAAWRALALGLLEYRRGNYALAEKWCQTCLAYPGSNPPRTATAKLILAMASFQVGRASEARVELAAAREIMAEHERARADRGSPIQGFWFDWAFARVLSREAAQQLAPLPAGGGR
jgi:hypothetical protein